jgi:hypothetical protein
MNPLHLLYSSVQTDIISEKCDLRGMNYGEFGGLEGEREK